MRNSLRMGGIAVGAAAATTFAVLPAGAVTAGHKVPPPPLGMIVVCNHSGYMFNVYADGPSLREDDLAGSFDECTNWDKVLTGGYNIGFGLRSASAQNVIIQARFKRNDHVYYKVFNREGIIAGFVNKDETTRVDLFIPQA